MVFSVEHISLLDKILLSLGSLLSFIMAMAIFFSIKERERIAFHRGMVAFFLFPLPFLFLAFSEFSLQSLLGWILVGITLTWGGILLFPYNGRTRVPDVIPKGRLDERDTMFSRWELIPGSPNFISYYSEHPAHRDIDDRWRKYPGLQSLESGQADPFIFAATEASFQICRLLRQGISGEPAKARITPDTADITGFVKESIKKWGAVSVGITELKKYHVYRFGGRGDRYGKSFSLNHPYAIAFTVEMEHHLMQTGPQAPTVMESAKQYLQAGKIAVQMAHFIRNMGYNALAHIDAAYQVVCPLVARDAGLGEIGRMGLLMTPQVGPRVRIAVVTTDLPLLSDSRKYDPTYIEFCRYCKKCARVCPSQAISFEDRKEINGVFRWQINQEKCFSYWCQAGTDCGRCVAICPYSHPNNVFHNSVRFFLRRSYIFRRLAASMDDLLYGKKPQPGDIPAWLRIKEID